AHDVVLAHGGSTLQPVALAARRAGRPLVYRTIGDPRYWGTRPLARLRVGLPLRTAAHVVALYGGAAEYVRGRYGVAPSRVAVVPNAIEPDRFPLANAAPRARSRERLGLPGGVPLVGHLGALSPEKRPQEVLELATRIEGAHVVLAGDGPLRAELAARASGLPTVHLLPVQTDPAAFLQAVDVLALASETEGVPAVVLEATLTGVPVVATDVGGVGETLLGIGAAPAVPSGCWDLFTEAVRRALAHPGEVVGDRDRVVAHHGLRHVVDRYAALLRGVAAGEVTPGAAPRSRRG